MKKYYDIAIIGGGAAGIICAVRASMRCPEKKIVLIEKADRIGKKLLVTGNGRCNLSNRNASAENYHGEGADEFINILFKKYNPEEVCRYFERLGLMLHTESDGRVYPLSYYAGSVLDVLRAALKRGGVEELTSCDIRDIRPSDKGYALTTDRDRIDTEKLVIAAGGRADYAGRESGAGSLYKMLSLPLTALSPALSPVKVDSPVIKSLKGTRVHGKVTLLKSNEAIKEEYGEIQFADNALSGICVFNLSRIANREKDCVIEVDMLPFMSEDELKSTLTERREQASEAADLMIGMFRNNIALALLKSCDIKPSLPVESLSDSDIGRLSRTITHWTFPCEPRRDFQSAQVTAGGIRLSEVYPSTFESRRHRGLYIIGEALDIDGDCGGYNLQFAFASGMCAGDSL